MQLLNTKLLLKLINKTLVLIFIKSFMSLLSHLCEPNLTCCYHKPRKETMNNEGRNPLRMMMMPTARRMIEQTAPLHYSSHPGRLP